MRKENNIKANEKEDIYRENLFSNEDFYLYRGVLQFYLEKYNEAINDFEESLKNKQSEENCENSKSVDDSKSRDSIDTDLSDVGLCAVNINDHNFNIILFHILVKYI